MKKPLLLYMLLAITITGSAQSLLTDNSLWTVERTNKSGQFPNGRLDYYHFHLKDSISIAGKEYGIMFSDSLVHQDTVGYFRNVGPKVYFKYAANALGNSYDTTEFLLYDFEMKLADTVNLRFDNYWGSPMAEVQHWRYKLVKIDSVTTVGGKRKRMKLQIIDRDTAFNSTGGSSYHQCYGDTLIWIEGVGSPVSILYPAHGVNCNGIGETWHFDVTCLHKDEVLAYQPRGTCSFLGNIEVEPSEDFGFYPNPVQSKLYISSAGPIKKARIYSFSGTLLLREEKIEDFIDVSSLKPGVFILEVTDQDGNVGRSKVVKE